MTTNHIPALRPGSRVGIVAPSGPVPPASAKAGLERLRGFGFEPVLFCDPDAAPHGFFSMPDGERLEKLQAAIDDDSLDAIWPLRGGYGLSRIIDRIDCAALKRRPKFLIGLSDLTLLAQRIRRETGSPFYYGPMVAALGLEDYHEPESLRHFLATPDAPLTIEAGRYQTLIAGSAAGTLIGGCLTLLAAAVGTGGDLDEPGETILFIEDLNEPVYRLDRMLAQLRSAGRLARVRGVICGHFENLTTPKNSLTFEQMLREYFEPTGIPVLMNFPCGHGKFPLTLPLYRRCEITERGVVLAAR